MIILGDETVWCLANCLPGPALSVHQRALAAWRSLPQEVQLQWNALVWNVEPHRPPFDHSTRISGYNLFVSAYHGFATLGNEQVPEPRAFEKFPPFAVGVGGASAVEGLLYYRFLCLLLLRLSLSAIGCWPRSSSRSQARGETRARCAMSWRIDRVSSSVNLFIDPSIWGLNLQHYQVHARFILLDTVTGYRSQYHQQSFLIGL